MHYINYIYCTNYYVAVNGNYFRYMTPDVQAATDQLRDAKIAGETSLNQLEEVVLQNQSEWDRKTQVNAYQEEDLQESIGAKPLNLAESISYNNKFLAYLRAKALACHTKAQQCQSGVKNPDYSRTVICHLGRCLCTLHLSGSLLVEPQRYAFDCPENEKAFGFRKGIQHVTNNSVEAWHKTVKHDILHGQTNLPPGSFANLMEEPVKNRCSEVHGLVQ